MEPGPDPTEPRQGGLLQDLVDLQTYLAKRLGESEQIVAAARNVTSFGGRALHDELTWRLSDVMQKMGLYGGKYDSNAMRRFAEGDPSGILGTDNGSGPGEAEGTILTARRVWHKNDYYLAPISPTQIARLESWCTQNPAMLECIQAAVDDAVNSVQFQLRLRVTSDDLLTNAISPAMGKEELMHLDVPSIMNSVQTKEEWRRFGQDFIRRQHESPFIIMAINADRKLYDPEAAVQKLKIAMNPSRYDTRLLPDEAFPGISHADKKPTFPCKIIAASNVIIDKYVCKHTGRDEYRARPATRYAMSLVELGWELVVYTGQRTVMYNIKDDVDSAFGSQALANAKSLSASDPGTISFSSPFDALCEEWAKTHAYESHMIYASSANAREVVLLEQPAPVIQGVENMTDEERIAAVRERADRMSESLAGGPSSGGNGAAIFGPQIVAAPRQGTIEYTLQDQEMMKESAAHKRRQLESEAMAAATQFSNASGGFLPSAAPVPQSGYNWHDAGHGDPITPHSRTLSDIGETQWNQIHARNANAHTNNYTWLDRVRTHLPMGFKLASHIRPTYTGPDIEARRARINNDIKASFKINDMRLQRAGGRASFSVTSTSSGRATAAKADAAVRIEMETWEDRVNSYRLDVANALLFVYEEIVALQERQAAKQRARDQYHWAGVQMRMILEAAEQCQKMHDRIRKEFTKLNGTDFEFVKKCNLLLDHLKQVENEALMQQTNYRHMVQNLIIALLQSSGLVTLEITVTPVPVLVPEAKKETAIASSSTGRDAIGDEPQAKKAKTGDVPNRVIDTMREMDEENVELEAKAKAMSKK